MAGDEIDLFGHPVRPGYGGRGRPPHVPAEEDRNRVKLLLALGWDVKRIAGVLGISCPTLRLHYSSELKLRDIARDALEARKFEVLWRQAEAGNVGALKRVDEVLRRADAERAERRIGKQGSMPAVRPAPIGKKEANREAAFDAEAALSERYGQRDLLN